MIFWVVQCNQCHLQYRWCCSDPSRQKGTEKIRHLCHTKLLFISVSLRVPGNVLWILNWHLFVHIVSTTRLQLCRDHTDNKGSTSAQKKYYFKLNKTFEWAHSAAQKVEVGIILTPRGWCNSNEKIHTQHHGGKLDTGWINFSQYQWGVLTLCRFYLCYWVKTTFLVWGMEGILENWLNSLLKKVQETWMRNIWPVSDQRDRPL